MYGNICEGEIVTFFGGDIFFFLFLLNADPKILVVVLVLKLKIPKYQIKALPTTSSAKESSAYQKTLAASLRGASAVF